MWEVVAVGWGIMGARSCLCVTVPFHSHFALPPTPPSPCSLHCLPADSRCVPLAVGRANCEWLRVNLKWATTRHQRPAEVSGMVLFCVLLIGVGGGTSKAPFTSALAPASGANNYLRVTACEVAVCGCRGVTIVVPRVCVVSVPGRAPTVSLAPPPCSPCSPPPWTSGVCIQQWVVRTVRGSAST